MISKLGLGISKYVERAVPDPFVIAILLTIVTAIAAFVWGDFGDENATTALLDSWRDGKSGIWKLLAFSMQMCLVLVTGYALATTRTVRIIINSLANIPNNTATAAALVGFVACVAGLLNWGLGLIVGALLAREVGFALQRKNTAAHYPLIAAAGYMGLLVWHAGLSGSAPLSMTTLDGAAKVVPSQYLEQVESILLSESIGSTLNFIISGGLLIVIPLMLFLLAPKNQGDVRPIGMFGVDPGHAEEVDEIGRAHV